MPSCFIVSESVTSAHLQNGISAIAEFTMVSSESTAKTSTPFFTSSFAPALDIIYETVSATATVGLSRNLTPNLGFLGKIIIIATMYLGRIGPISLAIAFNSNKETGNIIKNPSEEISVG